MPEHTDRTTAHQWRELPDAVRRTRALRREHLAGQQDLVAGVAELLFRHDPISLDFTNNTDEYRPEAETIVLRLPEATSAAELQRVVHEEFVHFFDADLAGPVGRYAAIAREIWELGR